MKKYFLIFLVSILSLTGFTSCSDNSSPAEASNYTFAIDFQTFEVINDGDKGKGGEFYFMFDVMGIDTNSLIEKVLENETSFKATDGDTIKLNMETKNFDLPNEEGQYFEVKIIAEENDGAQGKEYLGGQTGYSVKFEYPWEKSELETQSDGTYKLELGNANEGAYGILKFKISKKQGNDMSTCY